ncbi:putative aspartic endopeptidase Ecym_1324 [Eremothecium cymbalariae DBVPG|uniref:Peptidase A1 domain-containing protein n=1 Tax=Eremothecium cymbalariae (strain CBS 270.75 / DBVPG 7215 / KCTC 17166 / NRRL Y-17582) TaxID=931890 RepID=G8JN95_ERECY|nr:hypothetical protein Ecym_1324 [Eremothecium cymbalariae DBVPG\
MKLDCKVLLIIVHFLVVGTYGSDQKSGAAMFPTLAVKKTISMTYVVQAMFGTPGQEEFLKLDIIQPYTWVISGDIYEQCNRVNSGCTHGNLYYSGESTSFKNQSGSLNAAYNMSFIDYTEFYGSAGIDIANFTSVESSGTEGDPTNTQVQWFGKHTLSIPEFSFFRAEHSNIVDGSLGLGARILSGTAEDSSGFDSSFFFLDMLKNANFIKSTSYSIWLGNDNSTLNASRLASSDVGTLLLGAVDPNYFIGNFYRFKMLPFRDSKTETTFNSLPIVPLTKVDIVNAKGTAVNVTQPGFMEPVLLDPRYTISYLPIELILQIAMQTNAVYVKSLDLWLVDCDVANFDAKIRFQFGDLKIDVPLSHFVSSGYVGSPIASTQLGASNMTCQLNVYPNYSSGFSILGGTFLRSVYLSVDLEGNSVAMAQAYNAVKDGDNASSLPLTLEDSDSNSSTSSVKAIRSGYIPYATDVNLPTSTITMFISISGDTKSVVDHLTATQTDLVLSSRSFYDTTTVRPTDSLTQDVSADRSFPLSKPSNNAGAIQYKRLNYDLFKVHHTSSIGLYLTITSVLFLVGILL